MNQFVEVKTAELADAALDWAIAVVEGLPVRVPMRHVVCNDEQDVFAPSIYWDQGGPMTKYAVEISNTAEGLWMAVVPSETGGELAIQYHNDLLVALCRAVVAAKLGDVVQVPKELVG
jgi:hypothetical protein